MEPLVAGVVETRDAVDGEDLLAGDVVRTSEDPATLAEVRHRNGAVTRLDAASEVAVDLETASGRPRLVVTVGIGRTWHRTASLDDPTLFEVRAPGAVLTARFGSFALSCRADGSAEVVVVEGNVVVRGVHSGSVVLGDGRRAAVSPAGDVGAVGPAPDPAAADPWIALNRSLDAGQPAFSTAAPEVEKAPRPLPAWAGRLGAGLAAVAFVGVLVLTFVTADNAEPPAPSGTAAAMLKAAAPSTETTETTGTTAAPEPVPAPLPPPLPPAASGTVKASSCRQSGRMIVYSGTVANTSSVHGAFAVDAVFLTRAGAQFAAGTATVGPLDPGASARWEVQAPAPGDLRNTGASCETAGLRVLP